MALALLLLTVVASFLSAPTAAHAATTARKSAAPPGPTRKTPRPAASKPDATAERAAAVREISHATLGGTCSGSVQPDTIYSCAALAPGTTSYTLTEPQATDLLVLQVVSTDGSGLSPQLTAPDGSSVPCRQPNGPNGQTLCTPDAAGSYTLVLDNTGSADTGFTLAYLGVLSDASCTGVGAADTQLGAPTTYSGSLAAGAAGTCYTLPFATGDVLRSYDSSWSLTESVYDATGQLICSTGNYGGDTLDCTLTGTAPYRALISQESGAAVDYRFTAARLSDPQGCATTDPQPFGSVPAASTARCRILHVPADGSYEYSPAGSGSAALDGGLVGPSDGPLCAPTPSAPCTLTAGDHTWALNAADTDAGTFGIAFYAVDQTQGCAAAGDADFASGGPATGSFTGAGETFCLTLPTAPGNGVYAFNRPAAGGVSPAITLYDATGAPQQCQDGGTGFQECPLSGTAPFRVLLNGPASGDYQLYVQRTGDGTGCTAWPQSAFGSGSWGAQVALTATDRAACLDIPADQHSTGEMLDYSDNANTIDGSVQIFDASGRQVCIATTTAVCRLTAGTAYTAMLAGTGTADTYDLVRRDVSSTAACPAPASTAVGGPATAYRLGSALDARCLKVAANTGDKDWFSVRTAAQGSAGAVLEVTDPSGHLLCRQWGTACRVTGSTSYVVFVIASNYAGSPITAHVDTWRVGTASGWASPCTATTLSADGFALRGGVLSESATGWCAVVALKPSQDFAVYGTDSSTTVDVPQLGMFGAGHWNSSDSYSGIQCGGLNYGDFAYNCLADSSATAQQAVLVLSAGQAATPVEYSMQGVCTSGCATPPAPAAVTSLSPAAGPAGTQDQVVLHGTGLTLGTRVDLAQHGVNASQARPVSVSADGSTLTVLLDTSALAPGSYDLVLNGAGYTAGTPSQGYLPGAYTVTAAPTPARSRLMPITPARFLDTRIGLGAPKARVGAGGSIALQITGRNGVPATGVTAVVMNVTAVNPSTSGFVTAYPDGSTLPDVSSLNFTTGQTIPNLVTVPVGSDGKVRLYNHAGTVDLLADVNGYYTGGSGGSALMPITPARFLDTRIGLGAPKARVGAGGSIALQITGRNGVPATGVTAVVMNVTAVNPSTSGFVTAYPDGSTLPDVSSLNFTTGQTIPNLVTVPVGSDGKVRLYNHAGTVDLLADVNGYYTASGSLLSPVSPVRLLDTRSGLGARIGAVGPDGLVSMQVAGVDGVPATGVTAVVLNVTVTAPTTASFLEVYPHGQAAPGVSNLNFGAKETISNLVVVPVVDGRVTFYNHAGSTQVVADLNGYFS